MRTRIFRVIAGVLGLVAIAAAFPITMYAPDGFWPRWIHPIPFLLFGTIFLVFSFSGRAWPRSYNRKVFEDSKHRNDG